MNEFNLKDKKILKVINILDHDHDFFSLYNELICCKKEYFDINEKIIILHNDTEYFYHDSKVGFAIHNLLTCMREIDIPMHVVVILTNHYGYKKSIIELLDNNKDLPSVVFNFVNRQSFRGVFDVINTKKQEKNIKHFGIGLWGGTVRSHRTALVKWLLYNNLDKKVQFSYNNSSVSRKSKKLLPITNNHDAEKKAIAKNQNIKNIDFVNANKNLHRINETFLSRFFNISKNLNIDSNWKDTPIKSFENKYLTDNSLVDVYSECFLDIVSETTFMYPYPFISEKTLRPIFLKTPFLIFGPARMLNCLHDLGFKTFNNFWDESYDKIENPWERFDKICKLIRILSKISPSDLEIMYNKMEPILEYNKNLLDKYITNTYYPLYNEIEKHV